MPVPVVFRLGPYRFLIYSNEPDEPPHVHVKRDGAVAKLWLAPVRLGRASGFAALELRRIARLVATHETLLFDAWNSRPRP